MTWTPSSGKEDEEKIANAFGLDTDPLAELEHKFTTGELAGVDPFGIWWEVKVEGQNLAEGTRKNYQRYLAHWHEFMEDAGRHPALPNEIHVRRFANRMLDEKGHGESNLHKTLVTINSAYKYFQSKGDYPHPTTYNPFQIVMDEMKLSSEPEKEFPVLTLAQVQTKFGEIRNVRDRLIVGMQLKLGIRSSELCNIKLSEIHVNKSDLLRHYGDEMGTCHALDGETDAVFIPHTRKRNKSERPKILPLDDELKQLLLDYLLVRQDNGEPWLLLSMRGNQLDRDAVLYIWQKHWHPEFSGSDRFRPISPHYGRHFFTSWFKTKTDWPIEYVEYMRGDKHGTAEIGSRRGAIYEYVHTHYPDVKERYPRDVFELGVF